MKQGWKYYVIEFLVIVAGITVSFLISEWSSERDDKQHEIRILSNLERDLSMDTLIVQEEVQDLQQDQVFLSWLGSATPEQIIDSINPVLDAMCSYSVLSIHQSTYQEITNAGGAKFLQNKDILGVIVDYYSNRVSTSQELVDIGKNYVLNQIMPYIQQHVPALISLDDSSRRDEFIAAFTSDEFRNHILFSRSWKGQQAFEFQLLGIASDSTLNIIKAEISRLREY